MALKTQTFNNFDLNNNPQIADFLVGVCSDGSAEFKTPINRVGAYTTVQGTSSIQPILGGNTASGDYSVVSGGLNNVAGTQYSAVVGGKNNQACSTAAGPNASAFVGGGHDNCACGDWNPAVVGGAYNRATGSNSFVGAGCGNHAYGYHSAIVGGTNNEICNSVHESFIGAGRNNCLDTDGGYGYANVIAGGCSNSAYAGNNLYVNTISGGSDNCMCAGNLCGNTISGGYSNCILAGPIAESNTISGGYGNCIDTFVTFATTIGGGVNNTASAYYASCSTISGGSNNSVDGVAATISGGRNNCTSQGWAPTIAGGQNNYVHGGSSTIGGGKYNCVGGYQDGYDSCVHAGTIAGGDNNCITGNADASTIGGGCGNSNSGYASTVSGGYCNHSRHSDYTVIGGGCRNTIHVNNHCSSILGGVGNDVRHDNSHIIGSSITTCQSDATFVQNIISSGVVKSQAGAPNGSTGFTFNSDGGSDTGLFSYNYVDGYGNDGWVSLYSNDQEVLQASNAAVNYIRIKDTTDGHTYNLQVTNGAPVLTQVS